MMETPNPSLLEIFAALPLVNGRVSLAQNEVLRRLQALLPAAIDELNARNGWSGVAAIPKPAGYHMAPANLTEEFLNSVLVGVSVETSAQGVGVFRNEVQVVVYSVDAQVQSPHQVEVHWERAELIRGCLYPFLTGCVDEAGRRCWRQLEPTGFSMLPSDWAQEYSGTAVYYRLTQTPNEANWG